MTNSYLALTDHITAARRAVTETTGVPAAWHENQDRLQQLISLLGDAVFQAFAADAIDAPLPATLTGWISEGLARSTERELAIIASIDVG